MKFIKNYNESLEAKYGYSLVKRVSVFSFNEALF